VGTFPSHYDGHVTAINNNGTVMSGWPNGTGTWLSNLGAVPSAIVAGSGLGKIMAGSPNTNLGAWAVDGDGEYGFPLDANGVILTSAAIGNLDGDGWLELVVAGGDSVRCWELRSPTFPLDALPWPMFRHDRARTGCYGTEVYSGVDEIADAAPPATAIHSIHPNPFNPTTRVTFDVMKKGRVELAVYDVSGRLVAVLVDGDLEPGRYEASWNGRSLEGGPVASGVYFCRLEANAAVSTRKMVLLR
jgi:hypothetical protein